MPYLILQAASFVVVVAVFACFFRLRGYLWLLAYLGYSILDLLALEVTPQLPNTQWNWSGKLVSIVLACIAIPVMRISRDEAGLTLPRTRSSMLWTAGGTLLAVLVAVAVNSIGRSHQWPTMESLWFEATLPGIGEEIAYRGIAFALFARCFVVQSPKWAWVPPVLGPTVFFALGHGFTFNHFTPHLEWLPCAYAFVMGLILAVLRLRSKSLLGSVAAHNAANLLGTIVDGL